jgi:hypothetical protein
MIDRIVLLCLFCVFILINLGDLFEPILKSLDCPPAPENTSLSVFSFAMRFAQFINVTLWYRGRGCGVLWGHLKLCYLFISLEHQYFGRLLLSFSCGFR